MLLIQTLDTRKVLCALNLTPVMLLNQALDTRMAALRALGRRVILVGDLNISPAPLDSCEPGELFIIQDRIFMAMNICHGGFQTSASRLCHQKGDHWHVQRHKLRPARQMMTSTCANQDRILIGRLPAVPPVLIIEPLNPKP